MNDQERLWPPAARMRERLIELTEHADTIMDLLGWDTFLSGGLVLQTMLGERWPTDIDIYTTNGDLSRFASLGPFKEVNPEKDEFRHDFGYTTLNGVNQVLSATKEEGECKIDIIVVSGMMDVFSGFDFDFCKCWFDGEEFGAEEVDSILTKSCVTRRERNELRNYPGRRQKYEDRGFTIVDLGDDLSPSQVHSALTEGVGMDVDWLEITSGEDDSTETEA